MAEQEKKNAQLRLTIAKSWAKREITAATAIRLGGFANFADLYAATLRNGVRRMATLTHEEEVARDRFLRETGRAVPRRRQDAVAR